MRRFVLRLANVFRNSSSEHELDREIASHLALLQEDFEKRGFSPEEARYAAARSYGGVEQAKELHRDERSFVWVEQRWRDLRYGFRNLFRTPGFTAIAILTLALGIGANTAIFSVINAVLLRPLAYKDSDRLVTLLHDGTNPVAGGNFHDWREQSHSFEAMGAAEVWGPNLTGEPPAERIRGLKITQSILPMLGVDPLLGRAFLPGEDRVGNERKVMLSHQLWQRRFGGDKGVLGRPILLDGEVYTVVGVMPPGFQFAPFWATKAELWAPLTLQGREHTRGDNSLRIFARLKHDATLEAARADIASVTQTLEKRFPGTNRRVAVTPLKQNVVGKVERPLWILLGAGGFLLLIAAANVAHMLLARTADRQKEIAVRTALGASRHRVLGQFLTENLLLTGIGAAAGLLLAEWGTKALQAQSPGNIPRLDNIGVDWRVLLFVLVVTTFTAILFGLAPALQATVSNLSAALKEGGRDDSGGRQGLRLRNFLVMSEFALALVLLIAAGLMIRSFVALQSIDPGFDPRNVLSMVVSVTGTTEADRSRRDTFYRQLIQSVQNVPGVESASGTNHVPLAGDMWGSTLAIEGRPAPRPGEAPTAVYRVAMPGYFETMRIRLLAGRTLAYSDDKRAPAVVVINQRAAKAFWPGQDPIGQRISFNATEANPKWLTVVGVVADAKQGDWASQPLPETYVAALQERSYLESEKPQSAYITLVIRTSVNPADLVDAVKNTIWSINPNLPISEVNTMSAVLANATAQPRFQMWLLGVFAVVALLLAAIGIYGVMSYSISQRRREIGIRISLGANRVEVLQLLLRQGMLQVLGGTLFGFACALLLSQLMSRMLFGVEPTDPFSFASALIVLTAAALLAILIPAQRATRIEPMTALRSE
ncbi:MAG TPA: ABC transporter permease [Bryobacteraceae bacterium]|nr:ABC transporter permease [Bryobacteraceae bacterium]